MATLEKALIESGSYIVKAQPYMQARLPPPAADSPHKMERYTHVLAFGGGVLFGILLMVATGYAMGQIAP